jgi:hypothetical protein
MPEAVLTHGEDLHPLRHRVFTNAAKDRQLLAWTNGLDDPFLILQRAPLDAAVFLMGASYGRYRELLDEADQWPDGLGD